MYLDYFSLTYVKKLGFNREINQLKILCFTFNVFKFYKILCGRQSYFVCVIIFSLGNDKNKQLTRQILNT